MPPSSAISWDVVDLGVRRRQAAQRRRVGRGRAHSCNPRAGRSTNCRRRVPAPRGGLRARPCSEGRSDRGQGSSGARARRSWSPHAAPARDKAAAPWLRGRRGARPPTPLTSSARSSAAAVLRAVNEPLPTSASRRAIAAPAAVVTRSVYRMSARLDAGRMPILAIRSARRQCAMAGAASVPDGLMAIRNDRWNGWDRLFHEAAAQLLAEGARRRVSNALIAMIADNPRKKRIAGTARARARRASRIAGSSPIENEPPDSSGLSTWT